MKFSTVGILGGFFFTLTFIVSLFVLPQEWFPSEEEYIFFGLLQLFGIAFFVCVFFWDAFQGVQKRYYLAIALTLAISVLATAWYAWANTTFVPVKVYLFAVGAVIVAIITTLFSQVYQAGVRAGRRRPK